MTPLLHWACLVELNSGAKYQLGLPVELLHGVAGKGEARLRRAWKAEEQEDPAKGLRLGPTSLFISLHVYREPSFYKALSQKKEKLHQETFPLIWWNAQSLLQRRKHTTHKQP